MLKFLADIKRRNPIEYVPRLYDAAKYYFDTNLSTEQMAVLALLLKDLNLEEINTVTLPGENRTIDKISAWYCDEQALMDIVRGCTYKGLKKGCPVIVAPAAEPTYRPSTQPGSRPGSGTAVLVRQPYRPRSSSGWTCLPMGWTASCCGPRTPRRSCRCCPLLAPRPALLPVHAQSPARRWSRSANWRRVSTFRELSGRIGRHRVIWRYDPVVLSERTPPGYHLEQFDRLSRELCAYTDKCVMSFLDTYARNRRALRKHRLRGATADEMHEVASGFAAIARRRGLIVESCCEALLSPGSGVLPGRCIDAARFRA